MNTLTKTMKQNKITRKEVSKLTGISLPTLRKYMRSPELFPCKSANQIMKKTKNRKL